MLWFKKEQILFWNENIYIFNIDYIDVLFLIALQFKFFKESEHLLTLSNNYFVALPPYSMFTMFYVPLTVEYWK